MTTAGAPIGEATHPRCGRSVLVAPRAGTFAHTHDSAPCGAQGEWRPAMRCVPPSRPARSAAATGTRRPGHADNGHRVAPTPGSASLPPAGPRLRGPSSPRGLFRPRSASRFRRASPSGPGPGRRSERTSRAGAAEAATDRGSGTVWTLLLCVIVWCTALAVVVVAGVRVDRHRAATAADLAAVAGAREAARGTRPACAAARDVAAANGARLTSCTVSGLILHAEVSTPTRTWPGATTARAAAGPVEAPG
ncbi:Rv3654c family TadE-like protein [Nocardiopsis mangrovi]|uniref:Rv3654c family TadE-like protein n=1 Tax=Nocardiopsis mangrovi TaxID=1179818 RepID=A0ABV9DYM0_9ACTN